MTELTHDQLRRVLIATEFDNCDSLFWRRSGSDGIEGDLQVFAQCSDFFTWGCADCEPIETEDDVRLLEQARADLTAATGDKWPIWVTELYAARRRNQPPASFMLSGRHAMDAEFIPLFPAPTDVH